MNLDLLKTPERATTILPELVRFFREHITEDNWAIVVESFIKRFAGTTFEMPDPESVAKIRRDEEIVERLKADASVKSILDVLWEHKVQYAYLENIWRLVVNENLNPANDGRNRKAVLDEAAEWMKQRPRMANEIVSIYAMNARERAEVSRKIGRKIESPDQSKKQPSRRTRR